MKKILGIILLLATTTAFTNCFNSEKLKVSQIVVDDFKLGTGVNVSHWLSQSDRRGEERAKQITKRDFDTIAAMGFDHVRLPIDEVQMYDENMNRNNDAFELLENAINWTLENNMNIIIDMHITRSFHFNNENAEANTLFQSEEAQQHLVTMWKDLQKFLCKYPNDRLAYELLNEAISPTHEGLNKLEGRLISAIRKQEPNRFIVIGSNWQGSPETIQYMQLPPNDKHLIITFHYYNPLLLTHHQAPWTSINNYDGPITYPGMLISDTTVLENYDAETRQECLKFNGYWDKETIYNQIKPAIDKAAEFGVQAYCGEFGVYPKALDSTTRLQWYKDICSIFRENNIANAHWCYKGDFPTVDENLNPTDVPAILLNK